jgi:hypothetical protein
MAAGVQRFNGTLEEVALAFELAGVRVIDEEGVLVGCDRPKPPKSLPL